MADFIFRVESVDLTDEQREKVAAAIQGAVLTELARLDLGAGQKPAAGGAPVEDFLYRPVHWYGGLLIHADEVLAARGSTVTVTSRKTQP